MVAKQYFMIKWQIKAYRSSIAQSLLSPVINQQSLKVGARTVWQSRQLLFDLIVLSFQPLPFFDPTFTMTCIDMSDKSKFIDVEYRFSSVLLSLMFVRVIFLIRSALNYSLYTDQLAKKILHENYGFLPDVRFTLKCMISQSPESTVCLILIVSLFINAYLLRIYEIVYYRAIGYNDFEQFYSALWAVVITMGTVGFGDIVPVSHVGRLIMMATTLWGTVLFTLVIVAFGSMFNLSPHQKKAMHHLLVTRKAALALSSAYKYYNAIKSFKQQNHQNPLYLEMLKRNISFANLDQNLKRMRMIMNEHICDFRDERIALKRLKVNDGNEQRKDLLFIKGEILDLSQKFLDLLGNQIDYKICVEAQNETLAQLQQDQRGLKDELVEHRQLLKKWQLQDLSLKMQFRESEPTSLQKFHQIPGSMFKENAQFKVSYVSSGTSASKTEQQQSSFGKSSTSSFKDNHGLQFPLREQSPTSKQKNMRATAAFGDDIKIIEVPQNSRFKNTTSQQREVRQFGNFKEMSNLEESKSEISLSMRQVQKIMKLKKGQVIEEQPSTYLDLKQVHAVGDFSDQSDFYQQQEPPNISFSCMEAAQSINNQDLNIEEVKANFKINSNAAFQKRTKPYIDKVYSRSLKGDSDIDDMEMSKQVSIKQSQHGTPEKKLKQSRRMNRRGSSSSRQKLRAIQKHNQISTHELNAPEQIERQRTQKHRASPLISINLPVEEIQRLNRKRSKLLRKLHQVDLLTSHNPYQSSHQSRESLPHHRPQSSQRPLNNIAVIPPESSRYSARNAQQILARAVSGYKQQTSQSRENNLLQIANQHQKLNFLKSKHKLKSIANFKDKDELDRYTTRYDR
ncbi:hypothetical protein FGO68_gene15541 [Halteria grandinella]|uniref:Potassium channel domain-containing protein n=1 Tax=Halteria grandinella TaxID=5974 RepID=A0A8J8P1R8_HALGN|nr:hypothetical protein FGO68_gene15541 [Halteria grandinella]